MPNRESNEYKCWQTNTTKTTKHKQIVNKPKYHWTKTKMEKKEKPQSFKWKALERSLKRKWNRSNFALNQYEAEQVQWTWIEKQRRSKIQRKYNRSWYNNLKLCLRNLTLQVFDTPFHKCFTLKAVALGGPLYMSKS